MVTIASSMRLVGRTQIGEPPQYAPRPPTAVHLATIWVVAGGAMLSALFILAANSWMHHPVGYVMVHGRPQLTDICALTALRTAQVPNKAHPADRRAAKSDLLLFKDRDLPDAR